ncbi:preprotein translocase subunit SecA [symbiont of Argiope bruennichi]|uniref:preprotein translocase subunit SecA n=1 Tax=symbiont of Argiope bruennichi TaxID=2810479 RepID=UPI003DA634D8
MKFIKNYFSNDYKILKEVKRIALEIEKLKEATSLLSDEELKAKTNIFLDLVQNKNKTLDDILVDAYAVCREACKRIHNQFPFFVQLMGAIVLHYGDIAEMKTGEGKTLTAILPIYLNALTKKGVHIVTVNEYLSERDYNFDRQVLEFLGISCGLNKASFSKELKKEAYSKDVTFSTNSEIGFDYLRDNMVKEYQEKCIRSLNYCIIDEVDSVLIDESRTPLIISGGIAVSESMYLEADNFAKSLYKEDYIIDEESRTASLSIQGQEKAKIYFQTDDLYSLSKKELIHCIQNALKANLIFANGVEYIVKHDEILLVDQFTGRIMEGRSYSEGLQQAIQAKERVKIEPETQVVATITYQNFFRLYSKISGMTGTAKTEEDEFRKIYNMRVIEIPTNKPLIRKDEKDLIFSSKSAKHKYLLKTIKELHEKGTPILIGTTNIDASEEVSRLLTKEQLPHNVLNAKNHFREAEIIERAGQYKNITISTNMAGRGTDIKLGEKVEELGGLHVIGTERHESRRIDNQLRGRSGRQGDKGYSVFLLSIEDELFVRFAGDKLRSLFSKMGDNVIQSRLLSKSLTQAQKKIEGMNYDSRKDILEFDNIISQHRELVYAQRDKILLLTDFLPIIEEMIKYYCNSVVKKNTDIVDGEKIVNLNNLKEVVLSDLKIEISFKKFIDIPFEVEKINNSLYHKIYQKYYLKRSINNENVVNKFEKFIVLNALDILWIDHLTQMSILRYGIHLRGYAQKNPLQQYIEDGSKIFENFRREVARKIIGVCLGTLELFDEHTFQATGDEQRKVRIGG